MTNPKVINAVLEEKNIEFEVVNTAELTNIFAASDYLAEESSNLLRVVCFRGESKPYAIVVPCSSLLDLQKVEHFFGHKVSYLSEQQSDNYFKPYATFQSPAIPAAFDLNWMVDESIFNLPYVYIQSGDSKSLVKILSNQLKKLFDICEIGDYSSPIALLNTNSLSNDKQAQKLDNSFTPIRLKQLVDETFDLPAMPEISKDIMKLRVDPSADAGKLAAIVSRDPSLAAQVVSWASSPYYGYQGTIDSVETAIARVLGFELVMNLALGISIGKSLKVPTEGPLGLRAFWRQAIYCANLSEKLCMSVPKEQRPKRGLIYLSGLLHNFGYLLLGHVFPPQFKLINRTVEINSHIPVELIEYYFMGVSHEQVGAWLMKNWNMPDELLVSVLHHHKEEFLEEHAIYSNIVFVANRLLKRLGIGDVTESSLPPSTLALLSLSKDDVEKALQEIELDSESLDIMANQLVA